MLPHFDTCRTASYVFSTREKLGSGATCEVYKGRSKLNGRFCAVKVLTAEAQRRPHERQIREIEILSKHRHRNIVEVLAIEKCEETLREVIVMELCAGGSLLNVLADEPGNGFGLQEDEFLTFLRDVAEGLKYLRDHNVIHRDIKPGNIMRCLTQGQRSVYKLCDFGAARELDDINTTFHSIYGTEEYLHPDMYKRALLRVPAEGGYNQKVDLWSLGVTVYHAATGSLPFRPYKGRLDRELMHRITTEKASGVLSGVQDAPGGRVTWSRHLPDTCVLSRPLRALLEPMVAGLEECDYRKMWTFDDFYQKVLHIVQLQRLRLFLVHDMEEQVLYMEPSAVLKDIEAKLTGHTDGAEKLHVLCEGSSLLSLVKDDTPIKDFPSSAKRGPLLVIDTARQLKAAPKIAAEAYKYPVIERGGRVSFTRDMEVARSALLVGHAWATHLDLNMQQLQCVHSAVQTLIRLLESRQSAVLSQTPLVTEQVAHCSRQVDRFEQFFKLLLPVMADLGAVVPAGEEAAASIGRATEEMATAKDLQDGLSSRLSKMESALRAVKGTAAAGDLKAQWPGSEILADVGRKRWLQQLSATNKEVDRIAKDFTKHYTTARISHHLEEIHNFDRDTLEQCIVQTDQVYTEAYNEGVLSTYTALHQWLSTYREQEQRVESLSRCVGRLSEGSTTLHGHMEKVYDAISGILQEIPSLVAALNQSSATSQLPLDSLAGAEEINIDEMETKEIIKGRLGELKEGVKELEDTTDDVRECVKNNTFIVQQMDALLNGLMVKSSSEHSLSGLLSEGRTEEDKEINS